MFKRILTVCTGNICRSPTAEYLLRQYVGACGIQCTSAGLGALVGQPMDATALELLAEHGMDGSAHRACQLTPVMLREADLVMAMETAHIIAMTRLAPEASGRIFLLDKWLLRRDIPDPYRQQRIAFEHVYDMIDAAVASWVPYLQGFSSARLRSARPVHTHQARTVSTTPDHEHPDGTDAVRFTSG